MLHQRAPSELAGEAAIWQQMTDESSGKPCWSLTSCVLPYDRAPLLPMPPRALAPPFLPLPPLALALPAGFM